jgi:hypothetical protein
MLRVDGWVARERRLYGHEQIQRESVLFDDKYSEVDCSVARSDGGGEEEWW